MGNRPMKEIDEATISQWLDLDLENELDPSAKRELELCSRAQPELVAERRKMASLHEMLRQSRIAVSADFRSQVMSSLPEPAWRPRRAARFGGEWAPILGLMVILGLAAAWFLDSSAAGDTHAGGIAGAVADLLTTAVLAGSGLLFATWRGIGFGVEELLAGSRWNLAAFGAGVLCLNLLLYSLLKRRSARAEARSGSARDSGD